MKDVRTTEYVIVYQVTLAMCGLTLSLNLSCLLVCTIQFLFAIKLAKSSQGKLRTIKYLKEAAVTRICAIGGFFLSIPVFLTGIILYTFLLFESTPAIITSIVIGLGIVFCGAAVVHNVFVWQKEKNGKDIVTASFLSSAQQDELRKSGVVSLPRATLDLSSGINGTLTATGLELSTLV